MCAFTAGLVSDLNYLAYWPMVRAMSCFSRAYDSIVLTEVIIFSVTDGLFVPAVCYYKLIICCRFVFSVTHLNVCRNYILKGQVKYNMLGFLHLSLAGTML